MIIQIIILFLGFSHPGEIIPKFQPDIFRYSLFDNLTFQSRQILEEQNFVVFMGNNFDYLCLCENIVEIVVFFRFEVIKIKFKIIFRDI